MNPTSYRKRLVNRWLLKAQVPVDETDVPYGERILVLKGRLVKLRSVTLDWMFCVNDKDKEKQRQSACAISPL